MCQAENTVFTEVTRCWPEHPSVSLGFRLCLPRVTVGLKQSPLSGPKQSPLRLRGLREMIPKVCLTLHRAALMGGREQGPDLPQPVGDSTDFLWPTQTQHIHATV